MINLKMMRIFFALMLFTVFGLFNTSFAQDLNSRENSKIHYEIKKLTTHPNPDFVVLAAAEFTKFDEIRFIDKRREVKLKDSEVIIELYSANELKVLYNKEVCSLNVDSNQPYSEVELDFIPSKHPIFEIIKINN